LRHLVSNSGGQYGEIVVPHELDAFAGDFFDAIENALRYGLQVLHKVSVHSAP
jgi:hypothetical protein